MTTKNLVAQYESRREEIMYLYATEGRGAVSEFVGCRYNSCGHFLKALGINSKEMRHRKKEIQQTVPLNINPFIEETQTKHYLLGYVVGDGSISVRPHLTWKNYRLNISSSDKEHLEKIAEKFDAGVTGPYRGNYRIDINDTIICKQLIGEGIRPRKSQLGLSKKLEIPDKYFKSFACGLLDSDGSIMNKQNCCYVEWVGHPNYMEEFHRRVVGKYL